LSPLRRRGLRPCQHDKTKKRNAFAEICHEWPFTDQSYAYRLNRDFPVAKPAKSTHGLTRFHRLGRKKKKRNLGGVWSLSERVPLWASAAGGVTAHESANSKSRSRWEEHHGRCRI
jgi:hypothetical protein